MEREPDNVEWRTLRGRLHWTLGQDREALKDFTEAISRQAEYVPAHYYRGHTHWWSHNLAAAIDDYEEVLRRQPDHFGALEQGAMSYVYSPTSSA